MPLEISHSQIAPGMVAVALVGKMMMGPGSEQVVTLVDELLQQGTRFIIFDLSGVGAMDSTGVGRFISTYNKLAAIGGEMRMAGASGHVFQTFHISLLDQVFRFFPTIEEAANAPQ